MNLHEYYNKNKDEINSLIMEIAVELAEARLVNHHGLPLHMLVEPEDPNNPENNCVHYKDEYQDEFDGYYDKEHDRLTSLMKFDYSEKDGIARN